MVQIPPTKRQAAYPRLYSFPRNREEKE